MLRDMMPQYLSVTRVVFAMQKLMVGPRIRTFISGQLLIALCNSHHRCDTNTSRTSTARGCSAGRAPPTPPSSARRPLPQPALGPTPPRAAGSSRPPGSRGATRAASSAAPPTPPRAPLSAPHETTRGAPNSAAAGRSSREAQRRVQFSTG